MVMSIIGSLSKLHQESEKIEEYLEHVQLYFKANGIKEEKQVAVLLTVIGSATYALLSSLLVLAKKCFSSWQRLFISNLIRSPLSLMSGFTSTNVIKHQGNLLDNTRQSCTVWQPTVILAIFWTRL